MAGFPNPVDSGLRPYRRSRPDERAPSPLPKIRYPFQARSSAKRLERLRRAHEEEAEFHTPLTPVFLGIAAAVGQHGTIDIGFACHDGTYSIDFAVHTLDAIIRSHSPTEMNKSKDGTATPTTDPEEVASVLVHVFHKKIREYEEKHFYKFVGAGITKSLADMAPELATRMWLGLDIVPMVFEQYLEHPRDKKEQHITVDEEADSMARKSLMYFGPNMQPRLMVGYRNQVDVDAGGLIHLTRVESYKDSVRDTTWSASMKYIESLKERNTKIAFFNSTPLGGGVALMRHALIRFFRTAGVDCKWYVPKPKPEVFRITKTNHNILQGVADHKDRLTEREKMIIQKWACQNAKSFWMSEGGPLRPRSEGGADVIIVDDPQMPDLVRLAKELDPGRPVIFRSHIQIRSDLAAEDGTPTSEVWQWLWSKVHLADLFISHPVREFVPKTVDVRKVGYMPATTDWFDGLNKRLETYDKNYYMHLFNAECYQQRMTRLSFPARDYIVQIARFDPSKGIPTVLAAYAELRRIYLRNMDVNDTPQLVIAGHGAVDDPDASLIYDQTLEALEEQYQDVREDVIVMRLGPTDQLLDALMSNAKVALQLSTREGFEVKVSEALHKGIPTIATKAGGIPLQVAHGKSGYLVEPGDYTAVARHLHYLFMNEEAYLNMSRYAETHVSDEVSTIGNALCWTYLADALSKGEKVEPNGAWINDMAREKAGVPYVEGENRLPRDGRFNLTPSSY